MIGETAALTNKAHKGAFGKGTEVPYITHPIETVVIVSAFTDGKEIIAATPLHDVMENTGVTRKGLEDAFGSRVADLMMDESEDKGRSWQEQKIRTVRHLCTASWGIKILALRDKLSNMRYAAKDYLVMDGAIWQRFNGKDKRKHAQYCWGVAHALKELEGHLYFKGYVMLCKTVFGEDIISSNKDVIQEECE